MRGEGGVYEVVQIQVDFYSAFISAGPGPNCRGYMEARLSSEDKTRIIERLNRRRSETAVGLSKLPPAGDMLKLRWVEELAREAERWANQCRPPNSPEEQDLCRDLYSITVGQCVASVVGEAPGLRPETMVDMWFMQNKYYRGNVTSYLPSEDGANSYDDFAQMIWSRTYMVGCGRSRFMTDWRGRLRTVERLVCNFAPRGPAIYRPLWSPSDPATACPPRSRPDPALPALCIYQKNMNEFNDENSVLSLEDNLLLDSLNDIERNKSLDYIGSLDEIYLTKLAIMTMTNNDSPVSSLHSVEKRHHNMLEYNNSSVPSKGLDNNTSSIRIVKKKVYFVGRPKTYKVEDLNDLNDVINENRIEVTTRDIYDYYEYKELDDLVETTQSTMKTYGNTVEETKIYERDVLNATDISVSASPITSTLESISNSENINVQIHRNKTGLESAEQVVEDNFIDDYLTDAETARQLQEALERMESKLATPSSTPGKVRRELRNSNERDEDYRVETESPVHVEKNKTIDRGPMLSMVLKYMPYLKTYEKTILGDPSASRASLLTPYLTLHFITHLLFY
ncbi:uncharacterized protein LOC116767145 isoform X2 [Danaus plexippus]|uniref:uncharacterized protein LOC116767145 isoform X2 n=1 Tax=Danaus plexippus TaxID=13037 RepID=UPI002AAF9831|nr:uncharacterized protein LOC116767145 isoform X2 [Danaus plexippus]